MKVDTYYRAFICCNLEFLTEDSNDYSLEYISYPVVRETPCGVWIQVGYKKEKFINNNHRKRFAYPSKEEAFKALEYRLSSYKRILQSRLEEVIIHLAVYDQYKTGERK